MPIAGWNVSQIVQQVNGRTEGRASGKQDFDLRTEFFMGLDEMTAEKHYWWRHKLFSFQTSIGVSAYDLSSNGTGQANVPDCVEIEEVFVVNATPQQFPYSINPEFQPRDQVAAIYGNQAVQGLMARSGYFLDGFQNFVLSAPADQVYTVAGSYYAIPMVTDTTVDVIPLVPPNLHWGLIYVLERRVFAYLYGQEDPRYAVSNAAYAKFLDTAAKYNSFSSQQAVAAKTNRPAVQSSGGRSWGGSLRR
jgi:hypothetical protein